MPRPAPSRQEAKKPRPKPAADREVASSTLPKTRGRPPKTPRPLNSPSSPDLILNAAEQLVLTRGFGGTSIDMILEACQVTKGMFFYYFKSKQELGFALAQRTRLLETQALGGLSEAAHAHSPAPLEQLLFILEALKQRYPAKASAGHSGSLLTVFVYESELFSEETHAVMGGMVRDWKSVFVSRLKQLDKLAKTKGRPAPESVANHIVALIEGGQILARIAKKPALVHEQLEHCQNYLRLLYPR